MGKDSYWFRHDSNARNDPKMCQLLMLGGQGAKGSFWDIVEILRESENYKIPLDKLPAIAFACRFPDNAIDQMVECGLIERDGEHVWSKSLNQRMKHLDAVKKKRATAGRKGGKAKASVKQKPSKSQAKGQQYHSKAKAKPSDLKGSDPIGSDKKGSDPNKEEKEDILSRVPESGQGPSSDLPKSAETWKAYAYSYHQRYGEYPPHDVVKNKEAWPYGKPAQMNATHCCTLVNKLGAEIAPLVAAYYVKSNDQFYVRSTHQLNLLVLNADSFHTQWKTGNQMTTAQAREADRLQKTGTGWQKLIDEAKEQQQ